VGDAGLQAASMSASACSRVRPPPKNPRRADSAEVAAASATNRDRESERQGSLPASVVALIPGAADRRHLVLPKTAKQQATARPADAGRLVPRPKPRSRDGRDSGHEQRRRLVGVDAIEYRFFFLLGQRGAARTWTRSTEVTGKFR